MHRELNPQVFGTKSTTEKLGNPIDSQQPATGIMGSSGKRDGAEGQQRQVPYPSIDIKALEHQINTLKVALIQMEKRTEALTSKMEELTRAVHGRFERFSNTIVRMEDAQAHQHQDTTAKFAQIVAKVNERKITDHKVMELMDRHNGVIRNFENRLLSLQRLVSEQEMALHNSQAALEEARSEIARLKRL